MAQTIFYDTTFLLDAIFTGFDPNLKSLQEEFCGY